MERYSHYRNKHAIEIGNLVAMAYHTKIGEQFAGLDKEVLENQFRYCAKRLAWCDAELVKLETERDNAISEIERLRKTIHHIAAMAGNPDANAALRNIVKMAKESLAGGE